MRFRLALLTLTCYVAFATIGCTSKPPANAAITRVVSAAKCWIICTNAFMFRLPYENTWRIRGLNS